MLPQIHAARRAIEAAMPESGHRYSIVDLRKASLGTDNLENMHAITREIRDTAPPEGFRVAVIGSAGELDAWVEQLLKLAEFVSDRWPHGIPLIQRFDDVESARAWATGSGPV